MEFSTITRIDYSLFTKCPQLRELALPQNDGGPAFIPQEKLPELKSLSCKLQSGVKAQDFKNLFPKLESLNVVTLVGFL